MARLDTRRRYSQTRGSKRNCQADIVLVGLSLNHLANGVAIVTGVGQQSSWAMNAFAFTQHADGRMVYPAIGLGVSVPALIYALIKVAGNLWLAQEG